MTYLLQLLPQSFQLLRLLHEQLLVGLDLLQLLYSDRLQQVQV